MSDFPRRIQMLKWVPAERAVADAMQAVEAMGADIRLTDAVNLLGRARDRVADFVDGVKPESIYVTPAVDAVRPAGEGIRELLERAASFADSEGNDELAAELKRATLSSGSPAGDTRQPEEGKL